MEVRPSTRDALIRAARDLTVERGWDTVRMADVAARAGVSRQTVYNEFRGRAGLAEALAVSEVQHIAQRVRAELFAHGSDARAGCYAGILLTLEDATRNPLVRGILTSGHGGLLPYLTIRSDIVLTAAGAVLTEWASVYLPTVPPATVQLAVDSVIRLTVSHIMLPTDTPAATAAALAEVFARLLGVR
jgi:AcrR family transcriptional regulator